MDVEVPVGTGRHAVPHAAALRALELALGPEVPGHVEEPHRAGLGTVQRLAGPARVPLPDLQLVWTELLEGLRDSPSIAPPHCHAVVVPGIGDRDEH